MSPDDFAKIKALPVNIIKAGVCNMQSWTLLEQHGNGEIMMAGDANWIDEDMGCCPLLESW